MDRPPAEEATHQLEELIHEVDDLRRRVAALELRAISQESPAELKPALATAAPIPEVSPGLLAPIGRLLLGIAGAYLLRAITEAGILPQLTGTVAGLLYAAGWLIASIRTSASNRVSLVLEGLTSSAIAAPLLWEATTRFHALPPSGAAAALTFFIVLGQVVAWKHDHDAIAAITALTGVATSVALIAATLDPVPFAIALLIAAAAVEYGAIRGHALGWRWIIALAVDFCAFLLVYLTTRAGGLPQGYAPISPLSVIAVEIALVGVYLASLIARTVVRGLRIAWFEIAQLAAVVAFVVISNLHSVYGVSATMFAAAACYAAAFTGVGRRYSRNFHAYATFALILLIAGGFLLVHGLTLVVLWCVLALAATSLAARLAKITLAMQGAIFLLAAVITSWQLGQSWMTAIAAILLYATVLSRSMDQIPSTLIAALLAWSLLSVETEILNAAQLDASLVATFRTVLISGIAIALAWFGKRRNRTELIWVLYPWMAFGAGKLIFEDFRQGRPATLFLSLLFYGGTLIALPRLLRPVRPDESGPKWMVRNRKDK